MKKSVIIGIVVLVIILIGVILYYSVFTGNVIYNPPAAYTKGISGAGLVVLPNSSIHDNIDISIFGNDTSYTLKKLTISRRVQKESIIASDIISLNVSGDLTEITGKATIGEDDLNNDFIMKIWEGNNDVVYYKVWNGNETKTEVGSLEEGVILERGNFVFYQKK